MRSHQFVVAFQRVEKIHSDMFQITKCPHRSALGEVTLLRNQSKPGLTLKTADWRSWTYTRGSCRIQEGRQVIRAGVYTPVRASPVWLKVMVLV